MTHDQEKDKLLNAYYQDQTIAPDGKLRPTFSRLVERADKAEAELTRLTALLEDRQGLADQIVMAEYLWTFPPRWESLRPGFQDEVLAVADRLIAYLKGKE